MMTCINSTKPFLDPVRETPSLKQIVATLIECTAQLTTLLQDLHREVGELRELVHRDLRERGKLP